MFFQADEKESEMTIIAMMQASLDVRTLSIGICFTGRRPLPAALSRYRAAKNNHRARVCGLTYFQPQSFLDGNRKEPWVRVRPSAASAGRT